MRAPRLLGLALAAALALPASAPSSQAPARPHVLLITLDTVRADRLGAYGHAAAETPHLDRLAREGVRLNDATSASPLTAPAHAALLSGQYPGRLGIKNNGSTAIPEGTITLAEVLKEAGYRTGAFIGAFVVDRAYGFAQGFDTFDASFDGFRQEIKAQVQRPAARVVDPAIAWITGGAGASAPFFAWIHLYDAHTPYAAPPPFGARFASRPYDGEIAYVDAQIGRVVEHLRASGTLDRTLVIIVGDHGEALGDHGEEEHGIFLYDPVIRIPWIMRLPPSAGVKPSVLAEQVRSIDLLPTVLELLGLPRAGRVDGESVAGLMRGAARRDPPSAYSESWYPQLHFGWSRLRALRVGEWKYVDAPRPELYDLRADRAERRNVIGERGGVAARMAAGLDAIEKSFGAAAVAEAPQPDAETIERLRSLGYIGLAAPSTGAGRGADPKDKILELKEFRTLLTRAGNDLRAGRVDTAIGSLKRALALNERAYDAHVMLGSALSRKGDVERALGEFDAAALLNPVGAAPHLLAAATLLDAGRLDDARSRVDRAAELEPGSGEVALMRGRLLERAGRAADALAEYERAVARNPSDMAARGRLVSVAMSTRRHDLAEPHLHVLLKAEYQPSRAHFALGQIAEARGRPQDAAAHYREALRLEPGFAAARKALEGLKR
jgi:arylsulfatase A-like enzyme/Tfp pilus assembly protein PilF